MKTGISRKIDELGRIVIPKEIRNNLNIKINDEMEIIVENNNIILKKHTKLDNIEDLIEIMIKNVLVITNKNIFITDKTKLFSTKEKISEELLDVINSNKDVKNKNINITDELTIECDIYIIRDNFTPIGSVIINSEKLSEMDDKLIKMVRDILSTYLAE